VIALLLVGSASSAELAFGPQVAVNDPYQWSPSLAATAAVDVAPGARFQAGAQWYPKLDDRGLKTLVQELNQEAHVSPGLSFRRAAVDLCLAVDVVRGPVGPLTTALALYAGGGATWTHDDADSLWMSFDDPVYVSTADQVHPALVWGLSADLFTRERLGVRLRYHNAWLVEAVAGLLTEQKGEAEAGLLLIVPLGRSAEPDEETP
jgi:hypothetical protein